MVVRKQASVLHVKDYRKIESGAMSYKKWFLFFSLMVMAACGKSVSSSSYVIGIDPSWFPLELMGKEKNIYAFSNELLQEIARVKKVSFSTINKSSDDLLTDLQNEKYDAILASIQPYLFYEKVYDFSDKYLSTGPVLVVPVTSTATGLQDMSGKEVAVIEGSTDELIAEKNSQILIRTYDTIPHALNAIVEGTIDGMILSILFAQSYCQDLYQGELKIATPPLNNDGLRMISLHGQNEALIMIFNEGLQELKASGKYAEIAKKWGFSP